MIFQHFNQNAFFINYKKKFPRGFWFSSVSRFKFPTLIACFSFGLSVPRLISLVCRDKFTHGVSAILFSCFWSADSTRGPSDSWRVSWRCLGEEPGELLSLELYNSAAGGRSRLGLLRLPYRDCLAERSSTVRRSWSIS